MTAKMIKINLGEKTLIKEATLQDLLKTYKVMAQYEKIEDNEEGISELFELNLDYIIDLFGKKEGITKDDLYNLPPEALAPLMDDVATVVSTIVGTENKEEAEEEKGKSKK